MTRIIITPAAESDLVNIWLYIARDNPVAAENVYQAAEDTLKTLAAMPSLDALYRPRRSQLKGVRFFPVGKFQNYVLYYREQLESIEIIRVLHAHMDKRRRLEPEDCI